MKKLTTCIAAIAFMASGPLVAQDLENFFQSEELRNDSRILVEGYITPFMKGFGFGMANGWYNTAKPHKPLGFDLTVTVNASYVPEDDMFYDVAGLQSISLVEGYNQTEKVPTVFGPDFSPTYSYEVRDPQTNAYIGDHEFNGPAGLGLEADYNINAIPVPMATLGIGIFKNTDLKIRFVPKIDTDDYEFNMFGIGIMHDVKQYIPAVKTLPFDLSVFIGYTDLDLEVDLSNPNDNSTAGNKGTFDASALTFQGLISKKFSVLTVYGGLGFNRVRSNLNVIGTYETSDDFGNEYSITDPIKDMDFPAGGPRATIGMRLKLLILTFHADYTLQEYNVLSAGVGLSIR